MSNIGLDILFLLMRAVSACHQTSLRRFADKTKWIAARMLINVVMPEEIKQVMEECKEIFAGIQEKPAMPARSKKRTKRGTGGSDAQARRLSSDGGPSTPSD